MGWSGHGEDLSHSSETKTTLELLWNNPWQNTERNQKLAQDPDLVLICGVLHQGGRHKHDQLMVHTGPFMTLTFY
jgi:hypothetical protein